MFNEKVIKIIEDTLNTIENPSISNYDMAEKIARALWDSGLVSISSKSLDEQELNVYKWTAVENDGYTRMESGVANNILEAFIKAVEYSPSYHKYIEIKKLDKEDHIEAHKELLAWYKEVNTSIYNKVKKDKLPNQCPRCGSFNCAQYDDYDSNAMGCYDCNSTWKIDK